MQIGFENIALFLHEHEKQGLTANELIRLCGIEKKQKNDLRKTLRNLTKKKMIRKSNNCYFPTPLLLQKPIKSKKNSKKKSTNNTGKFISKKSELGILSDVGVFYPISVKAASGLFHGDKVSFYLNPKKEVLITQILSRSTQQLEGRIRLKKGIPYFSALDQKIPFLFKIENLPKKQLLNRDGFFLAKIQHYPTASKKPSCILIQEIHAVSGEVDNNSIIQKLKIRTQFSKAIQAELEHFPDKVYFSEKSKRKDLRIIPFITVDGKTAKDFDDAIYAERNASGWLLYVAIADVAEYIQFDSQLEVEAAERGNSVYFPNECIPMLPEKLSNELCSLKPNVNRNCIVCEIKLTESGEFLDGKLYEALIRSHARLTYEEIDKSIQTNHWKKISAFPHWVEQIQNYLELSELLSLKRHQRGSIDFNFPDLKFEFGENGSVDVERIYQTRSMKMIEQFMLEANEFVAQFCSQNEIPIFWRNHPKPSNQDFINIRKRMKYYGVHLAKIKDQKDLNHILEKTKQGKSADVLKKLILRSLPKALYGIRNEGHFGLSSSNYTHFTSPIRRYADLFLHMNLKRYFKKERYLFNEKQIANHISEQERLAQSAENLSIKKHLVRYLKDHIGETFTCKVNGMNRRSLFLEAEPIPFEGEVSLSSLAKESYFFEPKKQMLINRKTKRSVQLHDICDAILVDADEFNLKIEMKILKWIKTAT